MRFGSGFARCIVAVIGFTVSGALAPGADAGQGMLFTGLADVSVLRAIAAAPGTLRPAGPAATVNDADFIGLIAFAGAAPVSPSDRDRISGAVRETLRRHPYDIQRADASIKLFFIALPGRARFEKAAEREKLRYALETLPAGDTARGVLDRIDPVIVMDAAHKRIITAATLNAWQHADVWATGLLSAPGPRADFVSSETAYLKANFTTLPAERADAIEHVERNRDATEVVLNEAQPVRRARYLRESRPLALDAAQFPVRLAETMEQAYEVLVKQRTPIACLNVDRPGAPPLTPDLTAGCDR